MNFSLFDLTTQTAQASHPDWGYIATVAGLFFAAIQAHRYWRATLRLEDELAAYTKDVHFTLDRFEAAFRELRQPAAFVDRNSGRVAQATPGWLEAGLPAPGSVFASGDAAAAWADIPSPSAEGQAAEPRTLHRGGQAFRAQPLGGASLGLVLVQPE